MPLLEGGARLYAARRSYRWWSPKTSRSSITFAPRSEPCTSRLSGASLPSDSRGSRWLLGRCYHHRHQGLPLPKSLSSPMRCRRALPPRLPRRLGPSQHLSCSRERPSRLQRMRDVAHGECSQRLGIWHGTAPTPSPSHFRRPEFCPRRAPLRSPGSRPHAVLPHGPEFHPGQAPPRGRGACPVRGDSQPPAHHLGAMALARGVVVARAHAERHLGTAQLARAAHHLGAVALAPSTTSGPCGLPALRTTLGRGACGPVHAGCLGPCQAPPRGRGACPVRGGCQRESSLSA